MQKLVWQNAKGDELNLTKNPFGITNWEGFSNTGLNIQSQQVPFADGSVFLDALMEQRELSVTLAINDGNDLYRRYELKRQLISALNPKLGEGYLIYTNDFISKRIKCVAQMPIFPTKNSNDAGTQKGSLSWIACEPYWEDLEETTVTLHPNMSVSVENDGDVPVQLKINLRHNIKNPAILNQTTGRKISYGGNVAEGLEISTLIGNKYVRKGILGLTWNGGGVINDIVTDGVITIYVGDNIIVEDFDGNLTPVDNPLKAQIRSAAYGNGFFVAVSEYGVIRSTNGYDWEVVLTSSAESFVTFANGIFLTRQKSSKDGKSWNDGVTHRIKPAYGNGIWVSHVGNYLCSSFDGLNWTNQYSFSLAGDCLIYGNGFVFKSGSTILKSADGTSWNSQYLTSNRYFRNFIYYRNKYYAISEGDYRDLLQSNDAVTWDSSHPSFIEDEYRYYNLHVLKNKIYVGDSVGGCFTTEDFIAINIKTTGTTEAGTIKKLGDYYYLLGVNILKSRDCKTWEQFFSYPFHFSTPVLDLLYVDGKYIFYNDSNRVFWTEDLINLEESYLPEGEPAYIFYESDKFYCINGVGRVYTTTDFEVWTPFNNSSINEYFRQICYANGIYVGITYSASIYVTTDLQTWSQAFSLSNADFQSVNYVNNKFAIVGYGGLILESVNGIQWTRLYSGINEDLMSVAYGNGFYLFGGITGTLYLSFDLSSFENRSINSFPSLHSILFDGGVFYISCNDGCVYESNFQNVENAIANISKDSDMSLNLINGNNNIVFFNSSSEATAVLTYRKKYIGV